MSKITLSKFKNTTMLNQHFTVGDGEGPGPVSILSLHFMIKTFYIYANHVFQIMGPYSEPEFLLMKLEN